MILIGRSISALKLSPKFICNILIPKNKYDFDKVKVPTERYFHFKPPSTFRISPSRLVDNWNDIRKLKNICDPDFNHVAFKQCAFQALITVTELIANEKWEQLEGLLSPEYQRNVSEDKEALNLIKIIGKIEEINFAGSFIEKIKMYEVDGRRFCAIDMEFILAGPIRSKSGEHKVYSTEIFLRLENEYSNDKLPDWTITLLLLKDFKDAT